ncbi:MAG: methyltransferase domain-containing protein [Bacteroidota bacterium]|nr:methyltransferase domain-containing protein [Bacteroidota bacterium]
MEQSQKIQANRLNHLKQMVGLFDLSKPLDLFIKEYFQQHKNFGSRDRRFYRNIVYNYFRLANLKLDENINYHLAATISGDNEFADYMGTLTLLEFPPNLDIENYLNITGKKAEDIYPFAKNISEQIDIKNWVNNFFNKTRVWVRVEKGNINNVVAYLNNNNIPFANEKANTFSFDTNVDVKDIAAKTSSTIIVQDLSSQLAAGDIQLKEDSKVWDCCAGSGGKSLMLHSRYPTANFFVSDIRTNILDNLRRRFQSSGIKDYAWNVVDLLSLNKQPITFNTLNLDHRPAIAINSFDTIIVDAPCSGSGTWKRTPEQLKQFTEQSLSDYASRQIKILDNIIPYLKTNGKLIYMTCSIYKTENEDIVNHFITEKKLVLINSQYYNCTDKGGDSIFKAELQIVSDKW